MTQPQVWLHKPVKTQLKEAQYRANFPQLVANKLTNFHVQPTDVEIDAIQTNSQGLPTAVNFFVFLPRAYMSGARKILISSADSSWQNGGAIHNVGAVVRGAGGCDSVDCGPRTLCRPLPRRTNAHVCSCMSGFVAQAQPNASKLVCITERQQQRSSTSICATEHQNCDCRGEVRYGMNGKWSAWKNVSSSIACNNAQFGDPNPGVVKQCECATVKTAQAGCSGNLLSTRTNMNAWFRGKRNATGDDCMWQCEAGVDKDQCDCFQFSTTGGGTCKLFAASTSCPVRFKADPTKRNYADSVKYCQAQGMVIASIHSQQENDQVKSMIKAPSFIGATESAKNGKWMWDDGTPWDYKNPSIHSILNSHSFGTRIAFHPDNSWRDWGARKANLGVICRSVCVGKSKYVGESGDLYRANHDFKTINLAGEYSNPVVIVSVPTENGGQEAVVRVRDMRFKKGGCSAWCFDIRIQEPSCKKYDEGHAAEDLSWLVMEAGAVTTSDGSVVQAGLVTLLGGGFERVRFHQDFSDDNVVTISQVQSYRNMSFVKTRQRGDDKSGVAIALEGVGENLLPGHGPELVGWLALQTGTHAFAYSCDKDFGCATQHFEGGIALKVTHKSTKIDFSRPFAARPRFFASITTFAGWDASALRLRNLTKNAATVHIQEEQCGDKETRHIGESVGWMSLQIGRRGIKARPSNMNAVPHTLVGIGERGLAAISDSNWTRIPLKQVYTDAVIIAGPPTAVSGIQAVVRARVVKCGAVGTTQSSGVKATGSCLDIMLQRPVCNVRHGSRQDNFATVSWMVLTTGIYFTDEHRMFQVGKQRIAGGAFSQVVYHNGGFPSKASVIVQTQVQQCDQGGSSSAGCTHFVKTRQQPSDSSGFSVSLEKEGRAARTHEAQLQVGWFAIEASTGHIGKVYYEAGATGKVVTHRNNNLDFKASFDAAPLLFANMATFNGRDPAQMRMRGLPSTSRATIFVEEETCQDAETGHWMKEVVDYMAFENGKLGESSTIVRAHSLSHSSKTFAQTAVGEVGMIHTVAANSSQNSWVTVALKGAYVNPVVFGGVPTHDGGAAAGTDSASEVVVRFQNMRRGRANGCSAGHWCFDVRLQEPACKDDRHAREHISWMVLEHGVYRTDQDKTLQVGKVSIAGGGFSQVNYAQGGFASKTNVTVLTNVQTYNDDHFVKTRQQKGDVYGFSVALEQVGRCLRCRVHGQEVVGWVALESGAGSLGGRNFFAATSKAIFTHRQDTIQFAGAFSTKVQQTPLLFAAIATFHGHDACALRVTSTNKSAATLFIQEESCTNQANVHPAAEAVGLLALERTKTATIRAVVVSQQTVKGVSRAFGEVGRVRTKVASKGTGRGDDAWVKIALNGAYTSPCIFGGVPSHRPAISPPPVCEANQGRTHARLYRILIQLCLTTIYVAQGRRGIGRSHSQYHSGQK